MKYSMSARRICLLQSRFGSTRGAVIAYLAVRHCGRAVAPHVKNVESAFIAAIGDNHRPHAKSLTKLFSHPRVRILRQAGLRFGLANGVCTRTKDGYKWDMNRADELIKLTLG